METKTGGGKKKGENQRSKTKNHNSAGKSRNQEEKG